MSICNARGSLTPAVFLFPCGSPRLVVDFALAACEKRAILGAAEQGIVEFGVGYGSDTVRFRVRASDSACRQAHGRGCRTRHDSLRRVARPPGCPRLVGPVRAGEGGLTVIGGACAWSRRICGFFSRFPSRGGGLDWKLRRHCGVGSEVAGCHFDRGASWSSEADDRCRGIYRPLSYPGFPPLDLFPTVWFISTERLRLQSNNLMP